MIRAHGRRLTAPGSYEWMRPRFTLPAGKWFDPSDGMVKGVTYAVAYNPPPVYVNVSTTSQIVSAVMSSAGTLGGKTIVLPKGLIIPDQIFTIPRTAPGWTYFIPEEVGSLPPLSPGDVNGTRVNRITPAYYPLMPEFRLPPGNGSCFEMVDGCSHYAFRGIRFTNPANNPTTGGFIDWSPSDGLKLANYPDHMVAWQCGFHGGTGRQVTRAIAAMGTHLGVMDCWAEEIGVTGADSQFIWTNAGAGPFRYANNYTSVGGPSENFLIGGSPLPGMDQSFLPCNGEITGNVCTKPPWGGHKNHIEEKFGGEWLIMGNDCYSHNRGGQDRSIAIKLSGQAGPNPEVVTRNTTVIWNRIRQSPGGISVSSREDAPAGTHETNRVEVAFNGVWDLHNGKQPDGTGGGDGHPFRTSQGVLDVHVHHNTGIGAYPANAFVQAVQLNGTGKQQGTVIEDNVLAGADGVEGKRCLRSIVSLGSGEPGFAAHVNGGSFKRNLCVAPALNYANQKVVPSRAAVGFVDPANHDYRLAAGSPGKGAGLNGEDLGCPVATLNGLMVGVGP